MMGPLVALTRRLGLCARLPPPRPGLFLEEGRPATAEDAPPFNAELCDCRWKGGMHVGPGVYAGTASEGCMSNQTRQAPTPRGGPASGMERRPHLTLVPAPPPEPALELSTRRPRPPPTTVPGPPRGVERPRPGPMLQVVAGQVVTDQEAAILRGPPSERQASALFRLYGLATRMLGAASARAAVPGTNPNVSPGHGGDSPGTGEVPMGTPEHAANGTCSGPRRPMVPAANPDYVTTFKR